MRVIPALLTLLALAPPGYGQQSDISVETDLGEKYIIKMSAVYVEAKITRERRVGLQYAQRLRVLTEGADRIRQNMQQTDADYQNCLQGFDKKHCDYNRNSPKYVESERQRLEYVEANINKIKGEMAEEFKPNPQAVEVVLIKYRPIFMDLNSQRKGLGYNHIMCVSPAVPSGGLERIFNAFPKYRPVSSSDIALEAAEWKLCKRITGF